MGLVCLTDGMGLGHVVQSYVDEATISFTACREIMPDPEFYTECLQDSFDELLAASKTVAAKPVSTKKPVQKPAKKANSAKTKAKKPAKKAPNTKAKRARKKA